MSDKIFTNVDGEQVELKLVNTGGPIEINSKKIEEVELSEEELQQFYENHKDAIDMIGGLDLFESLLSLTEEQFTELSPMMLQLFNETLEEQESEQELKAIAYSQNYTAEKIEDDFNTIIESVNTIDFLSEQKKDFLRQIVMAVANKLYKLVGKAAIIVKIPCELEDNVNLPIYAHDTDAGLDIYAREEITIAPGETKIIGTGIKMAIPDGYAILIQPRSGQSAKTKLRIANTPGLIDSGYRDEIGVIIENIEPPFKDIDYEFDDNGEIHIKSILHGESYTIVEGQRFAQMRLVQVPKAHFIPVESVGEIGEDRSGGFGSTGI